MGKLSRRFFLLGTGAAVTVFASWKNFFKSEEKLSVKKGDIVDKDGQINNKALFEEAKNFLLTNPSNFFGSSPTLPSEFHKKKIFEECIFAVGDANDLLFKKLQTKEAIHPNYPLPTDWMSDAKCVISVFARFSEEVRGENASQKHPTKTWTHAYVEGERNLNKSARTLKATLEKLGYKAIVPTDTGKYRMLSRYATTWSHRHMGFVCGIGTFGVHKSMITKIGSAGRMVSLITNAPLEVTKRLYSGIYQWCNYCKACRNVCPPKAIDFDKPDHQIRNTPVCEKYQLKHSKMLLVGGFPVGTYTCGKCQVDVPCETEIPPGVKIG